MKNYVYLMLVLGIALAACQKDKNKPKQYSTWYINGQEYKTNEVSATRGKATHILGTDWNGYLKGFSIRFHSGSFPDAGSLSLNCSNVQNPAWC